MRKAGDSYCYVDCVVDEIADLLSQNVKLAQIEQRLEELPSGLEEYFRFVLRQIYERGRLPAATQILRLVAIAIRPLKVDELKEALRTLASASSQQPTERDKQLKLALDQAVNDIRGYIKQCNPLLHVRNDSLYFANDSARQFLFGNHPPPLNEFQIDRFESHFRTALFCLDYIKQSPLKTKAIPYNDEIFSQWTGLRYATVHWCEHARESGHMRKLLVEPAAFMLDEKSPLRQNWWQTYASYHGAELTLHTEEKRIYDNLSSQERIVQRELDKVVPPPLHMNARLGLVEWVQTLLERKEVQKKKKTVLNKPDANGIQPLTWAAMENHLDMAKVLLIEGADPDTMSALQPQGGSSFGALRKMKSYTREMVNHDGLWTGDHTVLYRAVFRGHVEMVNLLLAYHADPDRCGWADYST